MSITSGFFNSVEGDRKYNAEQMSSYFEGLISNGVYENVGNKLVVKAEEGMSVTVDTGRAMINCHWIKNDSILNLTIDPSHVQYSRYDAVIIRLDTSELSRTATIYIKKGTASSAPATPSLTRNATIYELCLAHIRVTAKSTSINQSQIIDQRSNTNRCGYVTGLIKQVDTSDLFNQYQKAYEDYFNESTKAFDDYMQAKKDAYDAWFADLTSELRVDTTLKKYQKVTLLTSNTKQIAMGIKEYTPDDIVIANINGIMLTENEEFNVIGIGDSAIVTFKNTLFSGNVITLIVIKSVIGLGYGNTAGQIIGLTAGIQVTKVGKSKELEE